MDLKVDLPPGWSLEGQMEKGEGGTTHFQGMLSTPKVAFSTIKKYFPRAHIEKARKKVALQKYVHKSETRLAEFTQKNRIPTIFEFQSQIAGGLGDPQALLDEFHELRMKLLKSDDVSDKKRADALEIDDWFMKKLDEYTSELIEAGERGLEFIAINPMWRSSWKRFWRSILKRTQNIQEDGNDSQRTSDDGEAHNTYVEEAEEGSDDEGEEGSESGTSDEESGSEAD